MTARSLETGTEAQQPAAGTFQAGRVLALSVCHFIHDVYSSFLAPLLPLLIAKHSLSLTQAGLLSTVMQVPALLNPVIGTLADRMSTRWFIILAPSLTAVPMSLMGLAPSYTVLLILMFLAGISVALFHVPAPVMVSRLSGRRVGRGMGFFMTGGELARSLGPLAAVGAVSVLGFEGFYPVMGVGLLASLWLYSRFADVPLKVAGPKRASIRQVWRQTRHVLLPLSGILTARGGMHAAMTAFLPTFILQETGNLWLAGAGLTIFEAAGVVGVLAAGSLSDVFGRRRVLLVSLVGAPLSLLLFTWLSGPARVVMLMFTGFTLLSTSPVMLAIVQEGAVKSPAAANGLYMMISFMARSAIVVGVGWLGDLMGLRNTYLAAAALGLLGLPFVMMLPRSRPAVGRAGGI
jgi:FSR family fosmidomycin resistance protein-like MFS transporter